MEAQVLASVTLTHDCAFGPGQAPAFFPTNWEPPGASEFCQFYWKLRHLMRLEEGTMVEVALFITAVRARISRSTPLMVRQTSIAVAIEKGALCQRMETPI